MKKYLPDEELIALEKYYFSIIKSVVLTNLGSILMQLYSQRLIVSNAEPDINNYIEHSAENIIQGIISEKLGWQTCSVPCSADSCYDCGNAIIHLDAKTYLSTEGDNINIEKNQTNYIKGKELFVGKNKNSWEPNLNKYEEHRFNGYIPNITYVLRFLYEKDDNNAITITAIDLISLPNGQLGHIFKDEYILAAGKLKEKDGTAKNVRFVPAKLAEIEPWRVEKLYKRNG